MKLIVHAPEGGRPAAPVSVPIPLDRLDPARMIGLVDVDSGAARPVQVDSRGGLCWWEDELAEDEIRTYKLHGAGALADAERVVVREFADHAEVAQADRPVAVYRFGADLVRPDLDSLASPAGLVLTGAGANGSAPKDDPNGEQRSCWVGWGDVNGVDHWSPAGDAKPETPGLGTPRGHGVQRHRRFGLCTSGLVFGRLGTLIDWLNSDGGVQFTEQRVFHFYAARGPVRVVDVSVRFGMSSGSVTFGDTPNGGMCALRVIPALSASGGGTVRNAHGESGQDECWGSSANWCDYSGAIEGQAGGVALLDCPFNVRHPTHWLVTDSGVMAANPFGLAEFVHSRDAHGGRTWHFNETIMFRYRILLYDGRLNPDQIEAYYRATAKPVHVDIE